METIIILGRTLESAKYFCDKVLEEYKSKLSEVYSFTEDNICFKKYSQDLNIHLYPEDEIYSISSKDENIDKVYYDKTIHSDYIEDLIYRTGISESKMIHFCDDIETFEYKEDENCKFIITSNFGSSYSEALKVESPIYISISEEFWDGNYLSCVGVTLKGAREIHNYLGRVLDYFDRMNGAL